MRMLGAMEGSHCPSCHNKPGPDCADKGRGTRHRKRIEQRELARSLMPEADVAWLRTLGPCFTDVGIDCRHGCNGDCEPSGSSNCNFTCHAGAA